MNKRNKPIIITGIIVLIIALIIFLVGGYYAGWDFAGWFRSQSCVWTCVLLGLYGVFVVVYLVFDRWRKL